MSLYGLYLRNPSTDLIFLLHMERTYIGAVQRRVNFDFSWKLKNENSLKKCKISYMDFAIFMSLYGMYLRNPSTDLIFLLQMERTYIGVVQRSSIFVFFFLKIEIFAKTENLWHVTSRLLCYNFVMPQCLTVFYSTVML